MSRRPLVPFVVAGIAGVMSGVYIFKPLMDNNKPLRSVDGAADVDKTAAAVSTKSSDGPASTVTTTQTSAGSSTNENQHKDSTKP